MKKILIGYLINGTHSGIDKYLLNVISLINDDNTQIDCLTNKIDQDLKKRLDEINVGLIEIPTLKHPVKQYQRMKQIIQKNQYDVAYFNISEAFNCIGVKAAHDCKVEKVVVHSHSSGADEDNKVKRNVRVFCHNVMKHLVLGHSATDYYACSYKAGEWMYPQRILHSPDFHVINNAVNVQKFQYNESVRLAKRKELEVLDKMVIGQIGSLSYAKNPFFLLDLAEELDKYNKDFVILMVGDGKYRDDLEKQIQSRNLTGKVRLLGVRTDVNELVQAMDIFALPSRFEGLPIVAIEAQISGLKTIISDSITQETALSSNCMFLSTKDAKIWAKTIMDNIEYDRKALDLSQSNYCFDLEQQRSQIKSIFSED